LSKVFKVFFTIFTFKVKHLDTILGVSKLSSKFQVTIPKDVREILKVSPGDRIVFIHEEGKIIIKKA